jgi:hypothetical protein
MFDPIYAGCLKKVRFPDPRQAAAELVRTKGGLRAGVPMEVYRCHFCDGYHVGHNCRRKVQPKSP